MNLSYNFWENLSYFLGGVTLTGVLAAISQIINLKIIPNSHTRLRVCMKKEGSDGR